MINFFVKLDLNFPDRTNVYSSSCRVLFREFSFSGRLHEVGEWKKRTKTTMSTQETTPSTRYRVCGDNNVPGIIDIKMGAAIIMNIRTHTGDDLNITTVLVYILVLWNIMLLRSEVVTDDNTTARPCHHADRKYIATITRTQSFVKGFH